MNHNQDNQTFSDSVTSNSFIHLILQPTRITSLSNTLTDNIFSNIIDPDIILGNLTATISDHLPQIAIIPNMFDNTSGNKSSTYERNWPKFDWENFFLDYFSGGWEDLLKIDKLNAELFDTYASLEKQVEKQTLDNFVFTKTNICEKQITYNFTRKTLY